MIKTLIVSGIRQEAARRKLHLTPITAGIRTSAIGAQQAIIYNLYSWKLTREAMPVDLRRADNSDASWLSDCTRAAYAVYIPVLGREPVPMTIDYRNAIDEYEVWIAESSKVRVGLLLLENHTDHTVIYSVAVLPAYERHGVGRELLNHAEKVAKLHGHRLVRLYTNELWERNIAIYRRLGYVDSHVEKYKGSNVIHLMKTLQS